jgi:hypothetical protein
MAWFRKRPDPISDRERALSDEIAQIEAQIKRLDAKLHRDQEQPRFRSTAGPQGTNVPHTMPATALPEHPSGWSGEEPIFEKIPGDHLEPKPYGMNTPEHYNELGVRKYDLPALVGRLRNHLRGPSASNPKLVSYLAAGGIQGLRPLRYEKRVARNRFIVLVIGLFLMLLGLIWAFISHTR